MSYQLIEKNPEKVTETQTVLKIYLLIRSESKEWITLYVPNLEAVFYAEEEQQEDTGTSVVALVAFEEPKADQYEWLIKSLRHGFYYHESLFYSLNKNLQNRGIRCKEHINAQVYKQTKFYRIGKAPKSNTLIQEFSDTCRLLQEKGTSEIDVDITFNLFGITKPSLNRNELAIKYQVSDSQISRLCKRTSDNAFEHSSMVSKGKSKIEETLADINRSVTLIDLEMTHTWFEGCNETPNLIQDLIDRSNLNLHVIEIDEIQYIAKMAKTQWVHAVLACRKLLKDNIETGLSEQNCRSETDYEINKLDARFSELIFKAATENCIFATQLSGTRKLVGYGTSTANHIIQILDKSDKALNKEEILKKLLEQGAREVTESTLQTMLDKVTIKVDELYGLEKHKN